MKLNARFLLYASVLVGVEAAPSVGRYAQQVLTDSSPAKTERLKVPGANPAYYCSDPTGDLFQIMHLSFYPTNPRVYAHLLVPSCGSKT
jgi:hypothetical protein